MKLRLLLTLFCVFILNTLQSAWAYSAFWNIDGWDAKQLKESGITIARWKHDQIGEGPAVNWIEISYDGAKGQEALMTLEWYSSEKKTPNLFRAVRDKGDNGPLKLLFAVPETFDDLSCVQIVVPQALADGAKREQADRTFGNPGWGGFTLRLSRIMQLAGPKADGKQDESIEKLLNEGSTPDSGNIPPMLRPTSKKESLEPQKADE